MSRMFRLLGMKVSLFIILFIVCSMAFQAYLYLSLGVSPVLVNKPYHNSEREKIATLLDVKSPASTVVSTPISTSTAGTGKKRVLIATMEVIGPSKGGGIATAYTALSEGLAEHGHDVTVLYTERYNIGEWEEWVLSYRAKGVRLVRLWDSALSEIAVGTGCATRVCGRSYRVYQWLRTRTGRAGGGNWFDIVHFHDNGGIGHFSELAKYQGEDGFGEMTFFAGAHGPHFWERLANEFVLDDLRHLEVDHMERKVAQLSDIVVSPSAYMVQWMIDMKWLLPPHTYVHQNILPKPLFQVDSIAPNQPPPVINEVVFFGRLERRKGLFTFLNALALVVTNFTSLVPIPANAVGTNSTTNATIQTNNTTTIYENALRGITVSFMGRSTLVDTNLMAHQLIERWCRNLFITCDVKSDMSQQEAITYLTQPNKFAVIASPVDNSPNTVLECLSYGVKFIASNTGGIPELLHPNDRTRVLFDPNPDDLARLLHSILVQRTPIVPATAAVPNDLRRRLWVDLHSSLLPDLFIPPKSNFPQAKTLHVTVCAKLWCSSNLRQLMQSIAMQDRSSASIDVILGIPSPCLASFQNIIAEFPTVYVTVIQGSEATEESTFRSWRSLTEQHHASSISFFLFVDPSSWLLHAHSISRLVGTALKTGAGIVSSAFLDTKNNDTIVAYPGCSGGNGVTYNCFGGENMLVNATVYAEVSPHLSRGADAWEFYTRARASAYTIEAAVDSHFAGYKLDPPVLRGGTNLAPSSSASIGKQHVVRHFADTLPPGFEPFVTVATHCLETNTHEPPSPEVLTQHIELVFVRGFTNSGVYHLEHIINTLYRVHVVPGTANFHIISNALRSFIAPPYTASRPEYSLHTKKWFLTFVRSFLLAGIPVEDAGSFAWAGEISFGSINPVIPGASYILARRDGRNVMVAYYYQNLWCRSHQHDTTLDDSSPPPPTPSIATICLPHSDLSLFEPTDLLEYEQDHTYFARNPQRLFSREDPFRDIARAWGDRIWEDEEAIGRIINRTIDARILTVEYEQVTHFTREWKMALIEFLTLTSDDQSKFHEMNNNTLEIEGTWELGLEQQEKEQQKRLWEIYFTSNAKEWFKQESSGSALMKAKYAKDMEW